MTEAARFKGPHSLLREVEGAASCDCAGCPAGVLEQITAGLLAPQASVAVGGFVCGPDSTRAKLDQVDADVSVLDADVQRSSDADFRSRWTLWRTKWKAWQAEHRGTLALMWDCGSVWQTCEQWEANLAAWRKAFTERGGKPLSPTPAQPPPFVNPIEKVADTIGNAATAIVVLTGAIGGLYLIAQLKKG